MSRAILQTDNQWWIRIPFTPWFEVQPAIRRRLSTSGQFEWLPGGESAGGVRGETFIADIIPARSRTTLAVAVLQAVRVESPGGRETSFTSHRMPSI